MPLTKFSRYTIEFPDGSRSRRFFKLKTSAKIFKKSKKLDKGKVIKVIFKSELNKKLKK